MSVFNKGYQQFNLNDYTQKNIIDEVSKLIYPIEIDKVSDEFSYYNNCMYLYVYNKSTVVTLTEYANKENDDFESSDIINIYEEKTDKFNSIITTNYFDVKYDNGDAYQVVLKDESIPIIICDKIFKINLVDTCINHNFIINKMMEEKNNDFNFPNEDILVFEKVIKPYVEHNIFLNRGFSIMSMFSEVKCINDLENIITFFDKIFKSLKFFGLCELENKYYLTVINILSTEYIKLSKVSFKIKQMMLSLKSSEEKYYFPFNKKEFFAKKLMLNYCIDKYGKENVIEKTFYRCLNEISYCFQGKILVKQAYEKCLEKLNLKIDYNTFYELIKGIIGEISLNNPHNDSRFYKNLMCNILKIKEYNSLDEDIIMKILLMVTNNENLFIAFKNPSFNYYFETKNEEFRDNFTCDMIIVNK